MHLAVAPVGSVLLAAAVGADFDAVDDLAAAGVLAGVAAAGLVAAGAAGLAAAAGAAGAAGAAVAGAAAVLEAFCTPPWPLQAPRPVAVEVVPSLHVVGAVESAAEAGSDNANAIKGAATSPTRTEFFMECSLPWFESSPGEL
ncbi:MAG TPA: hypothetical protein VKG63_06560 [Steroidobacteraceae bacterium]|nr:hypothetical protein [Steroidobacteraceae bacterium]